MANVVGRPITALVLSRDERAYLKRQVRGRRVARSLSERCRAILRCADGIASKSVANELGIHEHTVGKWRRRFLKDRIEGLLDEARPGRPRTIDDDQIAAVIERTLRSTPEDSTHWSIRSMATASAILTRRSVGYGLPLVCSHIARRASNFPATRCSWTKFETSSVFICHRQIGRWCSVSTRKARYKPSTANSLSCR